MAFDTQSNLWDLSIPPTLPSLADDEFIALLQKQFGVATDGAILDKDGPNVLSGNINPQQLTRFPSSHDTSSPLSDEEDDSPSPPSMEDNLRSRKQSSLGADRQRSGRLSDDEHAPKRKASEEDLDDEPSHKSQHTSSSKKTSSSRRKSTGNPNGDETRLLKRKEQNRAAQRAFRERKEKHVKDLEDKVAALEDRNQATVAENESLREVIGRLQGENMKLRQASFTFSVPASSSGNDANTQMNASSSRGTPQDSHMNIFNSPRTASSTTVSSHDSPQSMFANEKSDASSLSYYPQSGLSVIEPEQTATGDATAMDFGFGPAVIDAPYTTLASNPLYMSFRETEPYHFGAPSQDFSQQPHGSTHVNGSNGSFDFPQNYVAWPDVNMDGTNGLRAFDLTNSLDELFGGSFSANNGATDYASFIKNSPSSTISPVSHRNSNTPQVSSGSSSGSSPASHPSPGASSVLSPPAYGGTHSEGAIRCEGGKKCTKEDLRKAVEADPGSMFAPKETSPVLMNSENANEFKPCKGLKLPKTQKSEQNVEVMSAWRKIRLDPSYQDVDINKLCSEFASKARCDGSQVVIEPDSMREIMQTVTRKNDVSSH